MLYVFTGSDTSKAKAEARKKAGRAEIVFFGEGGESFEKAPSYLGSSGLFAPEVALIIDRPLESSEGKELLENYGEEFVKADIHVFVIAGKVKVVEKKLFPKKAEFIEFEQKGTQEYVRPNTFALADAFLAGDKKRTWIGYRKLITEGVSPEEIHGTLSWAVRSALLAGKVSTATESGLKPFVYSKSKRAFEKLGEETIEQYSRNLVSVYHRARAGEGTLENNLELLLLSK